MVANFNGPGRTSDGHTIFDNGLALGDGSRGGLMSEGDRVAQREPAARTRFVDQSVDQRYNIIGGVDLKCDSWHAAGLSEQNRQTDVRRSVS